MWWLWLFRRFCVWDESWYEVPLVSWLNHFIYKTPRSSRWFEKKTQIWFSITGLYRSLIPLEWTKHDKRISAGTYNLCHLRCWKTPQLIPRDIYAKVYPQLDHEYGIPWPYIRFTRAVVKTWHIITLLSNVPGLRAPWLTEQRPTMPSKCPFCRRKYSWSGAYEKYLRTADASLDIVLASTIQYKNIQKGELLNAHLAVRERQDYDYESDPGPVGLEPDAFCPDIVYESNAKVFNTTSACAGKQNHFKGAGEVLGDIAKFDNKHSYLCADGWAPFHSAEGFKLTSWFIDGKVSKSQINDYFLSGLGNAGSVRYSSMQTLENHLLFLDPYSQYLQWFEGQVDDGQRTLPFFYRHVICCIRYLFRLIAYRDYLVYAPQREYNPTGQRINAEMHMVDWR